MIRIALIAFFFIPYSLNTYADKIKAECEAAPFEIQSILGNPLSAGKLRAVDQTIAGFLDTDSYSLSITTECKGRGENKICLTKADSHFCRSPKNKFTLKSIKSDNSIIMIKDRCEGSWTKYHLIGNNFDQEKMSAYMEYQTFFQIKNQVHSGISIEKNKPVFLITSTDSGYDIKIVSFEKHYWQVNNYDPLRSNLKISLESYENDPHENYSFQTSCQSNNT
jgi:hypothetical protein